MKDNPGCWLMTLAVALGVFLYWADHRGPSAMRANSLPIAGRDTVRGVICYSTNPRTLSCVKVTP